MVGTWTGADAEIELKEKDVRLQPHETDPVRQLTDIQHQLAAAWVAGGRAVIDTSGLLRQAVFVRTTRSTSQLSTCSSASS
jgi:hypothetical protein